MFRGAAFSALLVFIALLTLLLTVYLIVMETHAEVEDEDKAFALGVVMKALERLKQVKAAVKERLVGGGGGNGEDPAIVEMADIQNPVPDATHPASGGVFEMTNPIARRREGDAAGRNTVLV